MKSWHTGLTRLLMEDVMEMVAWLNSRRQKQAPKNPAGYRNEMSAGLQ